MANLDELFQKYRGRKPTQQERNIYGTAPEDRLMADLRDSPQNIMGEGKDEPGPPLPPSYEDWQAGIGAEHQYSPGDISAEIDPYYNKQLGGLEYEKGQAGEDRDKALNRMAADRGIARSELDIQLKREAKSKGLAVEDYTRNVARAGYHKGLATEDYGRTRERTGERIGEGAAESGLYGSGVYQKELGEQLGDLQRGYERQWEGADSEYEQRLGAMGRQHERAWGEDSDYSRRVADMERGYKQQWGTQGSSDYQRQFRDINQGYERDWGAGEYTPYALRKFGIGQERAGSQAAEELGREQQSYDMYQRQFAPGGVYAS